VVHAPGSERASSAWRDANPARWTLGRNGSANRVAAGSAGTVWPWQLAQNDCLWQLSHRSPDDAARAPKLQLDEFNFGLLPMVSDRSRLARRFYDEEAPLAAALDTASDAARGAAGTALDADAALALGLVTAAPDDIDWDDEVRIAIEERAAMSPDALTGLEANLRFGPGENLATRVFGRLTAWQNWIFQRPNAVGEKGALKVYGTGQKSGFDFHRV